MTVVKTLEKPYVSTDLPVQIHLSVSHDNAILIAFVTAEKKE